MLLLALLLPRHRQVKSTPTSLLVELSSHPAAGTAIRPGSSSSLDQRNPLKHAFNSVFNDWSNPDQVVEGCEETVSRLAESQKQNPVHKCACLRTAEQTERLARFNEDANTESQMRQMPVHRLMMDSDTAHIDNEVHLSALEEGLTPDCQRHKNK
jgi:hypothetical protein